MRILLLCHGYNSLAQRLYVELRAAGHELSVEFDINDETTVDAVNRWQPELIIAPWLKRAIPAVVWRNTVCLIVHPGIPGDGGIHSLDRAMLAEKKEWGVTCLQAIGEMDAGPIWSYRLFPMRCAKKSSLYRREVTEAALGAVFEALEKYGMKKKPKLLKELDIANKGQWVDPQQQSDRKIDWENDATKLILNKINAADGAPGVLDHIAGRGCYLYNACAAVGLTGNPGELIATANGSICRATADGAVWLGHLRLANPKKGEPRFKLPAAEILWQEQKGLPDLSSKKEGRDEIAYWEEGEVGYLSFDFHNGAMSTKQCRRLLDVYRKVSRNETKAMVLLGGEDYWSNGIHLNSIEAAESPADESWANINAMDDLAQAILETDNKLTLALMRGNAGAGGVFLALCADRVYASDYVVLNPHYLSMGNLYGSEYWTWTLPRRLGSVQQAEELVQRRLPMGAAEAAAIGLIDGCFSGDAVEQLALQLQKELEQTRFENAIADKQQLLRQSRDMMACCREDELEQMRLNFYGFDPSYHFARYHFVEKVPKSRTPSYLARHRLANVTQTGNRKERIRV